MMGILLFLILGAVLIIGGIVGYGFITGGGDEEGTGSAVAVPASVPVAVSAPAAAQANPPAAAAAAPIPPAWAASVNQARSTLFEVFSIDDISPGAVAEVLTRIGDATATTVCAVAEGDYAPDLTLTDLVENAFARAAIHGFCAARDR